MVIGGVAAVTLAPRLQRTSAPTLAHRYLVAVAVLMSVRVVAYVLANVFGQLAIRPASTGPYDLTNLLVGALFGLALVHARRGGFDHFFRAPEVLLAMRVATGIAFVLAGLVNIFIMTSGRPDYFVLMGYTKSFHLFIVTAEVLGGAAILLPWHWLTIAAACGLTIDMFGALYTQLHVGAPLDAAAFAMLFRLIPLVLLVAKGRWIPVAMGAVACAVVAIMGAVFLHQAQPIH